MSLEARLAKLREVVLDRRLAAETTDEVYRASLARIALDEAEENMDILARMEAIGHGVAYPDGCTPMGAAEDAERSIERLEELLAATTTNDAHRALRAA
jgi:hypothetical protein